MTEEERDQIWEDIELVAIDAIASIARLLDALDERDKIAIYANLEQIAQDGIKQVNRIKRLH